MKRRAMIFKFEKSDKERDYVDPDLLDVEELMIDLKLLWSSDICIEYQSLKRALNKHKTRTPELKEFKIMCLDILSTLCLFTGLSPAEVIDNYLKPYQEKIRLPLLDRSITTEMLSQFIEEKELQVLKANQHFFTQGMESFIEDELRITSQEVLDFLKKRVADGSLELSRLDNSIVHQLMTQQGFKPQSNKQGLIWTKKL